MFKATASIEEAEIQGRLEGILVVCKRLLIKASGRVSGTIRYGQIEIECGGQIPGAVHAPPPSEPGDIMAGAGSLRAPRRPPGSPPARLPPPPSAGRASAPPPPSRPPPP